MGRSKGGGGRFAKTPEIIGSSGRHFIKGFEGGGGGFEVRKTRALCRKCNSIGA